MLDQELVVVVVVVVVVFWGEKVCTLKEFTYFSVYGGRKWIFLFSSFYFWIYHNIVL